MTRVVELGRVGDDALGELERERVHLPGMEARQRLAGEIPLVEELERRPPGCAAPRHDGSGASARSDPAASPRYAVV